MGLANIDGNRFKKMIMSATGTKGYLSSSVKNTLRAAGGEKLMKSGVKVSRQQAAKVMRQLKNEGLAHKMDANATNYVNKSFAKEARRQDMIKKQNIQDRQKEIAAEKATETQSQAKTKSGGKNTPQASAGGSSAQLQQGGIVDTQNPGHEDNFVGNTFGTTNLKPTKEVKPQIQKPKEWVEEEANIDDLAID